MTIAFKRRGADDERPTPGWLYDFIVGTLGFWDACYNPEEFDFLSEEPAARRVYCNPPFSRKRDFVERAIELAERGYTVMLLLPGDYSTSWFSRLMDAGADMVFVMGRIHGRGARYPSLIAVLGPGSRGRKLFVRPEALEQTLIQLLAAYEE